VANRHIHCLRRVRGDKQPTQIAALCADIRRDADLDSGSWREYTCSHAAIVCFCRAAGNTRIIRQCQGLPHKVCDAIYHLTTGNRGMWLVVPDMYRTLTAIGFFDRIGKDWLLHENESDSFPEYGKRQRGKFSGFCVLEPDCGILVVRNVEGGILHCVDAAQLGYERQPEMAQGCKTVSKETAVRRNVMDCAKFALNYVDWLDKCGMGPIKHTLASQAYYAWRKNCLDYPVVVHDNADVLKHEREALYGGRCEVYFMGRVAVKDPPEYTQPFYGHPLPTKVVDGPIYHLDATSLYAGVTCCQPIPAHPWVEGWPGDGRKPQNVYCRVCGVTVETQQPCLPVRRDDDTVIWPVGRFSTVVCEPELALLPDSARVTINWELGYCGYDLFTSFAQTLHGERMRLRADGKHDLEKVVKRLLQSIFGKFAQVSRGWQFVRGVQPPSDWAVWHRKSEDGNALDTYRCIAGRVERHIKGGEPPESVPVITAWVYSLARAWMWYVQLLAGREHVFYCDTDSVFVDRQGYNNLCAGDMVKKDELGRLRIMSEHNVVEFYGIKHYVADGVLTCAGIEKTPLTGGGEHKGRYIHEPITRAAASGRSPSRVEYPFKGVRHEQYRHGVINDDGSVTPIVLGR
jgi:hypothetical protein